LQEKETISMFYKLPSSKGCFPQIPEKLQKSSFLVGKVKTSKNEERSVNWQYY
jgi:hypothetical protein